MKSWYPQKRPGASNLPKCLSLLDFAVREAASILTPLPASTAAERMRAD